MYQPTKEEIEKLINPLPFFTFKTNELSFYSNIDNLIKAIKDSGYYVGMAYIEEAQGLALHSDIHYMTASSLKEALANPIKFGESKAKKKYFPEKMREQGEEGEKKFLRLFSQKDDKYFYNGTLAVDDKVYKLVILSLDPTFEIDPAKPTNPHYLNFLTSPDFIYLKTIQNEIEKIISYEIKASKFDVEALLGTYSWQLFQQNNELEFLSDSFDYTGGAGEKHGFETQNVLIKIDPNSDNYGMSLIPGNNRSENGESVKSILRKTFSNYQNSKQNTNPRIVESDSQILELINIRAKELEYNFIKLAEVSEKIAELEKHKKNIKYTINHIEDLLIQSAQNENPYVKITTKYKPIYTRKVDNILIDFDKIDEVELKN